MNDMSPAEFEADRDYRFLFEVLSSVSGRAFVWRLISECGVFQDTPIEDPLHMAASVSRGNFGKWLLKEVFTCGGNFYTLMQDEAAKREEERRSKEESYDYGIDR